MIVPRCKTCMWFEPEHRNGGGEGTGKCFVDPPTPHITAIPDPVRPGMARPMIQGIRPATQASDRCSRHTELKSPA